MPFDRRGMLDGREVEVGDLADRRQASSGRRRAVVLAATDFGAAVTLAPPPAAGAVAGELRFLVGAALARARA